MGVVRKSLLAALLVTASAFAQEEPAPETAAGEAAPETIPVREPAGEAPASYDPPDMLDEITVTAQKRVQTIQDVPISMTALTGQMLYEQGVTDVREALQLTPNARVDSAGFFAAPHMREQRAYGCLCG